MCFLNLFRRKQIRSSEDEYELPKLNRCAVPDTAALKRRKAEEELIAMFSISVEKRGSEVGTPSSEA